MASAHARAPSDVGEQSAKAMGRDPGRLIRKSVARRRRGRSVARRGRRLTHWDDWRDHGGIRRRDSAHQHPLLGVRFEVSMLSILGQSCGTRRAGTIGCTRAGCQEIPDESQSRPGGQGPRCCGDCTPSAKRGQAHVEMLTARRQAIDDTRSDHFCREARYVRIGRLSSRRLILQWLPPARSFTAAPPSPILRRTRAPSCAAG